jgi:diaminopimelate decarboxylase
MNRYLTYQEGELLFEDVALSEIAEEMYTPFYVYSKAAILEKLEALKQAFGDIKPMLAFSMKALDTTLVLKLFLEHGCALAVENMNEIQRAQRAGFPDTSLVLNSYGFSDRDIAALLKKKPLLININNLFELQALNKAAADLNVGVRIGLRINLGIDVGGFFGTNVSAPDTRFGIQRDDLNLALAMVKQLPQLNLVGLATNLGSQVVQLAPWVKMSEEMAKLYKDVRAQGFNLEYLDLGGGFPVEYGTGDFLEIKKIARNITPHVKDLDCRVILEPGRYVTAEAGVLVTTALGTREAKGRTFVICDAGFAEFPRSALYRLSHEVVSVKQPVACPVPAGQPFEGSESAEPGEVASSTTMTDAVTFTDRFAAGTPGGSHQVDTATNIASTEPVKVDVVGPGAEGLDYLAHNVELCIPKRGDLLAILNTGAYGRSMSNNYASRVRPPEIMIERDKFEIIRERETIDDLLACDFVESQMET